MYTNSYIFIIIVQELRTNFPKSTRMTKKRLNHLFWTIFKRNREWISFNRWLKWRWREVACWGWFQSSEFFISQLHLLATNWFKLRKFQKTSLHRWYRTSWKPQIPLNQFHRMPKWMNDMVFSISDCYLGTNKLLTHVLYNWSAKIL